MLPGKCVLKLWPNFHSLCIWVISPGGQILSQLSKLQVLVVPCTRARVNLKTWDKELRWDCTVQYIMFCGINGAAGVWVNLLGCNIWASLVLWYGNCPVCYSNALWPVFSLLGVFCHWWFWVGLLLYLFWNDCRLCCSLPNQWTMKCVSFSGSVLQSVWYTYSPGQWCALLGEQIKGVVSSLPDPSELPSPLFFFLFLFFNLQFF